MPASPARIIAGPPLLFSLLLFGGCASFGSTSVNGVGAPQSLRALFPAPPEERTLRGEAEILFTLAGRSASFPAAAQLRGPARFRLDLLDPFDRPAAIVFSDTDKVVQYRPAANMAALTRPLPPECGDLDPGEWVGVVLGGAPWTGDPGPTLHRSWWGRPRFERYEGGRLRQTVAYRREGEGRRPTAVTWFCGEEAVMRLALGPARAVGDRRLPGEFTVTYPRARLEMNVLFGEVEFSFDRTIPSPYEFMGPRVRWTTWDPAPEEIQ